MKKKAFTIVAALVSISLAGCGGSSGSSSSRESVAADSFAKAEAAPAVEEYYDEYEESYGDYDYPSETMVAKNTMAAVLK